MFILLPLSITLSIETGLFMILKHRDLKLFIVVSAMNLLFNPAMNIGLAYINDSAVYWIVLSACEVGTILIESLIVYFFVKPPYIKALLISLLANLTSWGIGYLLSLTGIYMTQVTYFVVSGLFLSVYLFTFAVVFYFFLTKRSDQ